MKKYSILVVALLVSLIHGLHGQNRQLIDSLNLVIKAKSGPSKIVPLFELAFQFINIDNEEALKVLDQIEDLASQSGDSLWIVKGCRVKGQVLYLLERIGESRTALLKASSFLKPNYLTEQMYIEHTLGKLDVLNSRYDNALKHHFRVVDLAVGLGDSSSVALALNSIGIVYYKLKDYRKGLRYLLKSLIVSERLESGSSSLILSNIGLCYAHLQDFGNARRYIQLALDTCGPKGLGKLRLNIDYAFGVIAKEEGHWQAAEEYFLKSFGLAKELSDTRFQFDNIYLLADIYIKQNDFKKAEYFLSEAENLIGPNTPFNLELIKIYRRFSELYLSMDDYLKASDFQNRYIHLKDSIYNEDLTTNLMTIESEYLERENRAKIAARDDIIWLKEEIISRQRIITILTCCLVLITFTLLIGVLRSYRRKKALSVLLDDKVRERTRDLEKNREILLRTIQEKDLHVTRVIDTVSDIVKSLKGLCVAGKLELVDPVSCSYILAIEKISSRVSSRLLLWSEDNDKRCPNFEQSSK